MPLLFNHDPSRVHPPGGPAYPEPAQQAIIDPPPVPATRTNYVSNNGVTHATVSLGEVDKPHRIVWVYTAQPVRGRGDARALLTTILADFDHDGRASEVVIRNVEVDCDPERLKGLFIGLGYTEPNPGLEPIFLTRPAPDGAQPLYAPQVIIP